MPIGNRIASYIREKEASMDDVNHAELEKAIAEAQAKVTQQGDIVRSLKAKAKDGQAEKVGDGYREAI